MNTEQILKVLKNERECIARQTRPLGELPQCRKDDNGKKLCELCDLCLPDNEILEVYDFLINSYLMTEVRIKVLQEETDKLIEILNSNAICAVMSDEWGREHFKGICPYTNKKCGKWTCNTCEVEERERRFAKGDTE